MNPKDNKSEKPHHGSIPSHGKEDRIEKGQQGIIPPKVPSPLPTREGDNLSDGTPGWTPPKEDR